MFWGLFYGTSEPRRSVPKAGLRAGLGKLRTALCKAMHKAKPWQRTQSASVVSPQFENPSPTKNRQAVAACTSLSVYCGFDPTADSLHLGNLLGIIVLSWFQR